MTQSIKEAYEEIPYPSYIHSQTHPDRLATMAKLFGMNPTPIEKCRVLELGCADGLGLMAFAYDLPDSEFVGIDLAANHIEQGNQTIKELGLNNIKLYEMDLMNFDDSFGKFDYIIAHGLIAWVPGFVKEKIFQISSNNLTENGIVYLSYNSYPGCHIRQMLRGMMLYHTRNITGKIERANQAASLVKFLAEIPDTNYAYRSALQSELEHYKQADIRNILFDDLGEVNTPFYFHELISQAEKYGLQFLSEGSYFAMQSFSLPENTQKMLEQIKDDVVRHQQYLDFIEGRRFHNTLLCHKHHKLSREPSANIIRDFLLTSRAVCESEQPDINGDKAETFFNKRSAKVATNNPLAKSALHLLSKAFPRYFLFDELLKECRNFINSNESEEKDAESLCGILFEVFGTGLVSLRTHRPKLTTEISEKPFASPIARHQAKSTSLIPTLLCESLQLDDELSLKLLELLDGTRNREQLRDEMITFIESDDSNELFDKTEKEKVLTNLNDEIENQLRLIAQQGLVVH
jgi:methyltransferase-like protein/protein-L-isoaspartate O-methyltransferase